MNFDTHQHKHYCGIDLPSQKEGIAFVLGHALYMKAIHGGKAKNDKIDAHKIAVLLRGGLLPLPNLELTIKLSRVAFATSASVS